MASSSDWVSALAEANAATAPGSDTTEPSWIDALQRGAGFIEGLPSMCAEAAPESVFDVAEVPDPLAEAFAKGREAGRAEALAEHEATLEPSRLLRTHLRALDSASLDTLADELAQTVVQLCGQVLADYHPDANAMKLRCQEAARKLGDAARGCALHLHPEDCNLLAPEMSEDWRIVPDEALARGELRLEGPDGSLSDSREDWVRAIRLAIQG